MLSRGCNQSAKISKDLPLTAGTHLRRQSLVVQESKTEDKVTASKLVLRRKNKLPAPCIYMYPKKVNLADDK